MTIAVPELSRARAGLLIRYAGWCGRVVGAFRRSGIGWIQSRTSRRPIGPGPSGAPRGGGDERIADDRRGARRRSGSRRRATRCDVRLRLFLQRAHASTGGQDPSDLARARCQGNDPLPRDVCGPAPDSTCRRVKDGLQRTVRLNRCRRRGLSSEPIVALRASVRRHRRAQADRCALRSIRPTRASRPLRASVDHTEARKNAGHAHTPVGIEPWMHPHPGRSGISGEPEPR
jgi:hypothetical protein